MAAKDHISQWISSSLSNSSEVFNNLPPCPYAKQAWLNNKVLVVEDGIFIDHITALKTYEVIIYVYDPKIITHEQLYQKCLEVSNDIIVALDDHPDNLEKVSDVVLNNGEYALILVQEREKLEQARKILKAKGYYKNWDPEYLSEVFNA